MRPSPAESRPSGGTRWLVYALTLGCVAIVAAPGIWPRGRDSFPLSSYPMFAEPRSSTMALATVLGVRADGTRVPLSPEAIAGARWVNMAVRLVREAVAASPNARDALCKTVAARVAISGDATVLHIELVRETFDTVAYFAVDPTPKQRHTYTRCPVPR